MNLKQIFVIAIIAMFLIVPFASAKQESVDVVKDAKPDKKTDEKAVDKTKERPKEVKNKDKDITGKITVTDSNTSAYTVTKEGNAAIKIKKDGEHTKAKVTIPKEELQKIDKDGDKLYGVLHIADDGTATHDVVTESELVAGTEMVFSENIVNGYTGYSEYTFTGVTSGQTLDIEDVSGSDYYITASINGTIPSSTIGVPQTGLIGYWPLVSNTTDMSGHGLNGTISGTGTTNYLNGSIYLSNARYVVIPHSTLMNVSDMTLLVKLKTLPVPISSIQNGPIAAKPYTISIQKYSNTLNLCYDVSAPTRINRDTSHLSNTSKRMYFVSYNGTGDKKMRYGYDLNRLLAATVGGNLTMNTNPLSIKTAIGPAGLYSDAALYSKVLNTSEYTHFYAGCSGISLKPSNNDTWTRYTAPTSTEKIISVGTTTTGIEYVDTTNTPRTVTIRVYFTEDITKTTETKDAVYQNVSIVHTKQNATASVGTISYELDPLYSGTPVLSSNNTNATVSRNDTHAIISTGLIKQGQSFSYAVSVQDDHNHGIHLGNLMKWVGTGWDFVNTAPEDWTNYIGDQIEVTVS